MPPGTRRKSFKILVALLVLFARKPARAQTQKQATAFIQGLYHQYTPKGDGPDFTGKMAPRVFSPGLVALIRKDQREAKGEVGKLDEDPLCDCQDADGLKLTALEVAMTGAQTATAPVTLRFSYSEPNSKHILKLLLVWTPAGWRIDDIVGPEPPSLRKLLR